MQRRFREHDVRAVFDLAGIWDFQFLGDVNADEVDITSLAFADLMAVPACFDATPAYAGQRGLVAYRREIWLDTAAPYRLIFDGVHHWCRVIVDGQVLGEHSGGFTRFSFDLPQLDAGTHELLVLVDNRLDMQRSPLHMPHFDWYHYGGIARGVELHRLGTAWIDGLSVVTNSLTPPAITVTIDYTTMVSLDAVPLQISWDGQLLRDETLPLPASSGQIIYQFTLPDAALWSPDAPNLHLIYVRLGNDDRRERVGLRLVEVSGQQILLNGQPLRLLGFNRHEAHPQFGHSQPEFLLVSDIQQLKALGCNFVRGSHYPQDQLFLDLCDEVGLCVWSESIGWQHTAEHLTDPQFLAAQQAHVDEMVQAASNHASIIIWGVLNEAFSHEERSRPAYQTLLAQLRMLDPSRPVTYASFQPFGDHCFDLADIISINTYPGWYIGSLEQIPETIDQIIAHLDAGVAANKPLIISEIGAGAIPGWRDAHQERWSEPYQAKLLDRVIRYLFTERQRVCGLSIWLFNDFRTPESVMRPRSYNDKGIVDEYRRPKEAFAVVQKHFHALRQAGKG